MSDDKPCRYCGEDLDDCDCDDIDEDDYDDDGDDE
ncbi:hypothetical protein LCGC14_0424430 [marine sediment metagenome]|uniref:Uncharacterized protein n=1 Tax=marine sediment metagenome TaxID=412755 RepID=A0A0F9VBU4_9ZZZZ